MGGVRAEAWYWKRRGTPEKYALNDTVSNMTMGLSYKLVDGVFVALLGSAFFDLVHPYGLQYQPVHGIWSVLLIFVISDFTFYVSHFIRSEEHTSELQSLMRISYAVFCLTKKTNITSI